MAISSPQRESALREVPALLKTAISAKVEIPPAVRLVPMDSASIPMVAVPSAAALVKFL
jgi:hypothetical protein